MKVLVIQLTRITGSLLVLLMLFACTDEPVSPEKNGHIKGRVLDAETNQGIAGANITTSPPSISITTDNDGYYRILNLEEGGYTVSASKNGYNKGSVSVAVENGDTTTANILLTPSAKQNRPPTAPAEPTPENGSTGESVNLDLSWSASDPDGDSLVFDVYFYPASAAPALLNSDIPDTTTPVSNLQYNTTYYWQVVAKDDETETNGTVWSFTTLPFPDNAVVFTSQSDGNYNIYSATPDTINPRVIQISSDISRDWWPRMSPARDKIAFTSDRSVESQIYTMNRDGSDVFKVTAIPVAGYHNYGIGFCWTPDGTQLLYSNYERLLRIDATRSNLTQIATAPANRHFREVEWSPLGNKIVVLTIGSWFYNSEIYIMNTDGSDMTQLIGDWPGAIESPSFSPDGQKVLFTYDVSGHEVSTGRQLDSRIFVVNIDNSDTTMLSQGKPAGTNDMYPRFSPDGGKIIFSNAPNDGSAPPDIWIIAADGSNRRKLITNGTMPDWQ